MKEVIIQTTPGQCYMRTIDFIYGMGFAPSRTEAKRLLRQGAFEINGVKTTAPWLEFKP